MPAPTGSNAFEDAAVEAVVRRLTRGGVRTVVVASPSGRLAVRVARALDGLPHRLVCVADTPEWTAYGHPYPALEERYAAELRSRGAHILRDYRSSSAGAPRFDPATGSDVPMSAAEAALFWAGVSVVGGEGVKTAVKAVVLATDYGLLEPGERVVSLAGRGERAAALVLDAIGHAGILAGAPGTRLRVREVLHLPP